MVKKLKKKAEVEVKKMKGNQQIGLHYIIINTNTERSRNILHRTKVE